MRPSAACNNPCKQAYSVRGDSYLGPMRRTTRKPLLERLLDAIDLIIDFGTLGEYGYEAVEPQA